MCVRYNTIDERWERFIRRKNIWVAIKLPPNQSQLFPGGVGNFVRAGEGGRKELVEGKWGLQPQWAKVPNFGARNCYNARIEGSEHPKPGQKPGIEHMASYRDAFKKRRGVVLMNSYYESADVPKAKAEGRYVEVVPEGDEPFAIAALWEEPNDLAPVPTYTLVTTHSVGELAEIHSRRLARLDEDAIDAWMSPDAPIDLLKAIVQPLEHEPIRLREAEPPQRPGKKKTAKDEEPGLF